MAAHKLLLPAVPVLFLLALFLLALPLRAETAVPPTSGISSAIKRTGLPVPRFASLRSADINMRVGPGARYPVAWVYHRKGLPVEIVAEFDTWRKIRDPAGDEGWVHQATLSGKRSFLVAGKELQPLFRKKEADAPLRAQLQPNVQGRITRCWEDEWCRVEVEGLKGYMKKGSLWGVYPNEKFD